MSYRVYKSTLNRANGATTEQDPVPHVPLTLIRGPATVTFTPVFVESIWGDRLRVVSAQMTVFLEVDND
jgi:hypothetical protein